MFFSQGQLSPELAQLALSFNPFRPQHDLTSADTGGVVVGGANSDVVPSVDMHASITDSDFPSSASAGEYPSDITFRSVEYDYESLINCNVLIF